MYAIKCKFVDLSSLFHVNSPFQKSLHVNVILLLLTPRSPKKTPFFSTSCSGSLSHIYQFSSPPSPTVSSVIPIKNNNTKSLDYNIHQLSSLLSNSFNDDYI